MQAVKAVRQSHRRTEEILSLLEDFRCMVNDCIRIGLRENVTSMKSLCIKAYILAKGSGVRFTPDGPPEVRKEAVKGNKTTTPILRAGGGKVIQG